MFLIFHNKIANSAKIGLALGFGGMIILVGPSIGGQGLSLTGVTSLLISSMLWGLGSIYSGKSFLPQNFLLSAGMVTLVGGALLIIPSFLIGEFNLLPSYSDIDSELLISYIFLVFIGTVVPFAEFYWLLKVSTPPIANTFAYIAPIVAVFLGWAILDESVTYLTIIATIVILIGVALIIRTLNNKQLSIANYNVQCRSAEYTIESPAVSLQYQFHFGTIKGTNLAPHLSTSSSVIQEAKKNNIKHIVMLSSIGVKVKPEITIGRLHRQEEKIIEESDIPYTFLRANGFMQNFVTFYGQTIKTQNAFYLPAGDHKVSFVDARDIAAVAVRVLTIDGIEHKLKK